MSKKPKSILNRGGRLPWLVTLLTLTIFGLTLWMLSRGPREAIREQIIQRDRDVLQAATLMQQRTEELNDPAAAISGSDDPLDLLAVVLETSKLKGVLAIRLFDREGRQVASVPPGLPAAVLNANQYALLRSFQPVSEYHPKANLDALFEPAEDTANHMAPLLNVYVPVHREEPKKLLAIAEFVMDGHGIAEEFIALDKYLLRHGVIFFLIGSLIISAALAWAFKRLQAANRELALRTTDLLRANHELTLKAKTSALGAVTAHLIHGLKNPLFGLQAFVSNGQNSKDPEDEILWEAAAATTQRMHQMIGDVVNILQEQEAVANYEISFEELAQIVLGKVSPGAQGAGVVLESFVEVTALVSNHTANLVILILNNLLQNAIQATPRGGRVSLRIAAGATGVECLVSDQGLGLPEHVRNSLFTVTRSTKSGGSGLGLAISKQLAEHIGVGLELSYSGPEGARFVVKLPLDALLEENSHGKGPKIRSA